MRILRTAKFAARFADRGFRVADETRELMRQMVQAGEADALVPDRVWKETETALSGPNPAVYFEVLRDCGALKAVFPEIDALFGVPQPPKWHPEIDCGVHCLMVLTQAASLSDLLDVRFAALVHDLGKAETPKELLPSHHGHEQRSVEIIRRFAKRLPVPTASRELALAVAEFHGHAHRALELRSGSVCTLLERCDAFRRPERFERFLLACEADARGRTGFEDRPYPQAGFLAGAFAAARAVAPADVIGDERDGQKIALLIREARVRAIADWKASAE